MSAGDKLFAGSIPEKYDRYMVPLIFERYAAGFPQTGRRAFAQAPCSKSAAGSGVVTRALAPRLSPDASDVATDLNQPMLDYAATRKRRTTASLGARRMRRRCRSKMPPSISLAASSASMFFPDSPSAYREARRVLQPGGRFLFNVWDRIAENVFADAVTPALAEFFPSDPPRFLARTPHGYHDTALIRSDLAKAGFANVTIETWAEAEPRPLAPSGGGGLLPGHAAAQRDRGPARRQTRSRHGYTPHLPSRASMEAARLRPRSRRMSFWRGSRPRRATPHHSDRITIRSHDGGASSR